MKRVGIIGGMGPEATVDLFRKIIEKTPASKDQEHIPIVIDNYPQIPDRTAYIKGEGQSPLPFLLESLKRLEGAGVNCFCMPCNTAHYFSDELKKNASIPFINMIEATLDEVEKDIHSHNKIGLMATEGTILGRVYHKVFSLAGIEIVDFQPQLQSEIMMSIYELKSGNKLKAVEYFKNAFKKIKKEGYDCLVAGCTEIPLLVPYLDAVGSIKIIDATMCLAKKVVKYCYYDAG